MAEQKDNTTHSRNSRLSKTNEIVQEKGRWFTDALLSSTATTRVEEFS